MTPKYPDICPQNLIEPWWEEIPGEDFKPGRLIWAFLPHVDQSPLSLEPVGRTEPTEHSSAHVTIKRFSIGARPKTKNLPVAALPVFEDETLCVYRTKKRPAIIISDGGSFVEERLTRGKSKWRTARTLLVAPSYSVKENFSAEFCDRVRRCEYPQFLWESLPIGGAGSGSIIRFDHLQPVGRDKDSVQFTPYCLSDKAMVFIMEWIDWLLTGSLDEESEFCETRTLLRGVF